MKKKLAFLGLAVVLVVSMVLMVVVPASAATTEPGISSVEILNPLYAAPEGSNTGGYIDATIQVTANASGYYMMGIYVLKSNDNATLLGHGPMGYVQELVFLNAGNNTVDRLVTIMPNQVTETLPGQRMYGDVVAEVNTPENFQPLMVIGPFGPTLGALGTWWDNGWLAHESWAASQSTAIQMMSVVLGPVPGGNLALQLGAKSIVIVMAVLDKFVIPSKIDHLLQFGDANQALTPEGRSLVDGASNIVSDGVGMVGGVVSNIKGAVVSKVPDIVKGGLSIASEALRLFSSDFPMTP